GVASPAQPSGVLPARSRTRAQLGYATRDASATSRVALPISQLGITTRPSRSWPRVALPRRSARGGAALGPRGLGWLARSRPSLGPRAPAEPGADHGFLTVPAHDCS